MRRPLISDNVFQNAGAMRIVLLAFAGLYVILAVRYLTRGEISMVVANLVFVVIIYLVWRMAKAIIEMRTELDQLKVMVAENREMTDDAIKHVGRLNEINRRLVNSHHARWREESIEKFQEREGAIWS